ncbi:MAG: hypothetical protein JWO85_37 [Candidatus Eremiobacteraeota bacterium]|nr:hypothetical protein [Candidatus Eremiobacteraeota bacterium]
MLNPRAVVATAIVIVAAGCSQNTSVPAVGPPPPTTTPSAVPSATPAGATPTPSPPATPVVTATPTATPSATPTATPTATPSGAAVVPAPSALAFTGLGAALAQGLSVAQAGFVGSFSQTNTCAGVASVSAQPPSPTFTITPIATGTCSITITGGSNQSVDVPVTVTTSGLVVSGRRNHQ